MPTNDFKIDAVETQLSLAITYLCVYINKFIGQ
jgi:hypothetical protein